MNDRGMWWILFLHAAGSYFLGATWLQVGVIAAVAAGCWYVNIGRGFVYRGGLTLMALGLAVWTGVLAPPGRWLSALAALYTFLKT